MYRIGVDVGGTFTDVILVNSELGKAWAVKVPTTPQDLSAGVVDGITRVLEQSGSAASEVGFVGHGTTIATNLLVLGKGARAALITTKGFRDILEIRRSARHDRVSIHSAGAGGVRRPAGARTRACARRRAGRLRVGRCGRA